jgi:hypothetical protein
VRRCSYLPDDPGRSGLIAGQRGGRRPDSEDSFDRVESGHTLPAIFRQTTGRHNDIEVDIVSELVGHDLWSDRDLECPVLKA